MNEIIPKLNEKKLPAMAKLQMDEVGYPALYNKARDALRACVRVDEVKDIADKHSAIAHYAKQVKDETLLNYAKRIKLRAFERMGCLLKEIPDEKERKKVVKQNRIGPAQASQAIRMQDIPPRVREKLIDQKEPPALFDMGKYGDRYTGEGYYGGFSDHAEKEQAVRHTLKYHADQVARTSCDLYWLIRNCEANKKHEEFTPEMIAKSINRSTEYGLCRKEVRLIMDFLIEIERDLKERWS